MTKIVFCFAGTGDPGDQYAMDLEYNNNFNDDVIRVYLRGCQDENIGGGDFLFPDLDIAANKIRNAFNQEDGTIDLQKLQHDLGDGICRIAGPKKLVNPQIESIGLQGFSRGAVSTFATAKKLNDLNIPMDIIANQPVPGEFSEQSALYTKYHDLTQCTNIRSATTLLATHNLENGFLHNKFFHQMVAKFPEDTKTNTWLMPHQAHLEWFAHHIVPIHIQKLFLAAGYASLPVDVNQDLVDKTLKRNYVHSDVYFTPREFSQKVFGANGAVFTKDPVYLEMIREQAHKIFPLPTALTDEQASAIVAISKTSTLYNKEKAQLYLFVSESTEQAKKFTQIVTKVDEVTNFLAHVVRDEEVNGYRENNKSRLIKLHSQQYKGDVFKNSYAYLTKDNPTPEEKKEFTKSILEADKRFDESALSIDRGVARKALKIITNTILHVTGLFLIANTLNLAINGEWLFFNKTRSGGVIKNVTSDVKDIANTAHISKEMKKEINNSREDPEQEAGKDHRPSQDI